MDDGKLGVGCGTFRYVSIDDIMYMFKFLAREERGTTEASAEICHMNSMSRGLATRYDSVKELDFVSPSSWIVGLSVFLRQLTLTKRVLQATNIVKRTHHECQATVTTGVSRQLH